jgi:hypothetical protein
MMLLPAWSLAQLERQSVAQNKIRNKSYALGLHIHNHGLSFDFQYTRRIAPQWQHWLTASIGSLKDPRERRIDSDFASIGIGRPFIYDKKNYAYTLGLTYGIEGLILHKTPASRFSLTGALGLGPVLCVLKPYYIAIPGTTQPVVDVPYEADRYPFNIIVGESDYFRGMNDLSTVMGGRLKSQLTANLAGSTLYVRAIQLGIYVDLFARPIEILDSAPDRSIFTTFYLGFLLGNAYE